MIQQSYEQWNQQYNINSVNNGINNVKQYEQYVTRIHKNKNNSLWQYKQQIIPKTIQTIYKQYKTIR